MMWVEFVLFVVDSFYLSDFSTFYWGNPLTRARLCSYHILCGICILVKNVIVKEKLMVLNPPPKTYKNIALKLLHHSSHPLSPSIVLLWLFLTFAIFILLFFFFFVVPKIIIKTCMCVSSLWRRAHITTWYICILSLEFFLVAKNFMKNDDFSVEFVLFFWQQ